MKKQTKARLKEEWPIIFTVTFASIMANYGFSNYLEGKLAFDIIRLEFWTSIVLTAILTTLISIAIIYVLLFWIIDKIFK